MDILIRLCGISFRIDIRYYRIALILCIANHIFLFKVADKMVANCGNAYLIMTGQDRSHIDSINRLLKNENENENEKCNDLKCVQKPT